MLGGITPAGTSLAGVSTIVPGTGAMAPAAALADPTHDAGTATIGKTTFVFGGGSPDTVATVQAVATPTVPPAAGTTGTVVGQLPQPRSDLAVATVTAGRGARATTTAYLVGGYDGTTYLPGVLATSDGTHFTTVARLSVPVRYPAVVAAGGMVYCFGGQTASSGSSTHGHRRHPADRPGHPPDHRGGAPPPGPLRRRRLRPRRHHLRGRRPEPRRAHTDPDLRLRPVDRARC